jgi:hypothetical protein
MEILSALNQPACSPLFPAGSLRNPKAEKIRNCHTPKAQGFVSLEGDGEGSVVLWVPFVEYQYHTCGDGHKNGEDRG